MYSRYGDNSKRPVRLPEHYGGSVFSQQQPTAPATPPRREPIRTSGRDAVEEKASPTAERFLRVDVPDEKMDDTITTLTVPTVSDDEEIEKEEKMSVPSGEKASTASPLNFAGLRRLFGGGDGEGDQDRLLLLGLILLLSRSGEDSDILLWLSLLLLCG